MRLRKPPSPSNFPYGFANNKFLILNKFLIGRERAESEIWSENRGSHRKDGWELNEAKRRRRAAEEGHVDLDPSIVLPY